jgi:hypothetical protein
LNRNSLIKNCFLSSHHLLLPKPQRHYGAATSVFPILLSVYFSIPLSQWAAGPPFPFNLINFSENPSADESPNPPFPVLTSSVDPICTAAVASALATASHDAEALAERMSATCWFSHPPPPPRSSSAYSPYRISGGGVQSSVVKKTRETQRRGSNVAPPLHSPDPSLPSLEMTTKRSSSVSSVTCTWGSAMTPKPEE